MRYLLIIFLFDFWFLSGNGLVAQTPRNLNNCISFAIKNNIGLQNMEIREQMASEELKQAKRNLLPGISASSRAGISFGRSVDPNTNDIVNTDFFDNSYEVGTSLTLFNGFRQINQIEYRKYLRRISELNRQNATDDLAFSVMISYFEVLYQQGMLKIATEQVETSRLSLRKIDKQVELGMKSKTELLEMRANLEAEELRRIQAENSLKTAVLQLKQRMNLTGDTLVVQEETAEQTVDSGKQNQQSLFAAFTKWSPYYLSFEAQVQASKKAVSVKRSYLFPSITAYGAVGTGFFETTKNEQGRTIGFSKQVESNLNQYLGASVNIPVFSRWSNRSEVKKANFELEQAKNTLEEEKQRLWFEMAGNLNELEALEKEYKQNVRQLEADQLAFLASEKKFEQGVVNVIDFYISKNRLANSGSQVLNARLRWVIKKKVLDFYMGKRFWEQ